MCKVPQLNKTIQQLIQLIRKWKSEFKVQPIIPQDRTNMCSILVKVLNICQILVNHVSIYLALVLDQYINSCVLDLSI